MPEYLAPGVYVEETSFRSKSIEGVSTTTTGFIGPARFGPLNIEPDVITSLGEFERTYGGRERLSFRDEDAGVDVEIDNYLWHGARAFFEEGGKRLYATRIFLPRDDSDGRARETLPAAGSGTAVLQVTARYPGAAGNFRVRITLKAGQNILVPGDSGNIVRGAQPWDIVLVRDNDAATSPVGSSDFYVAERDDTPTGVTWRFVRALNGTEIRRLQIEDLSPADGHEVRIVTATVEVIPVVGTVPAFTVGELALDRRHRQSGTFDSLLEVFRPDPPDPIRTRLNPLVLEPAAGVTIENGLEILEALFTQSAADIAAITPPTSPPTLTLQEALDAPESGDALRSVAILLANGDDGVRPDSGAYEGDVDTTDRRTGLKQFEDIEDISIVAAPGSTFGYNNGYQRDAQSILNLLISHCARMRYRIAVLDCGNAQSILQVRQLRARYDSTYAALYYPWVKIVDPLTRQEIALPPSGFVAGIYARNDINRAVWKAPANEVVNLAIGFEQLLNKAQQDVLNPEGINCFRYFEGRGFRLWGARTISSDPEWKYVNLRRYFAYLERSIDRGTQWAVFEPNGEELWDNVRRTIYDFLFNEFVSGALLGEKPEKAFFVKCDRSTMTQNDLDNGRLICLIGVAPLRPAEFVIFRIGQWTADRKV